MLLKHIATCCVLVHSYKNGFLIRRLQVRFLPRLPAKPLSARRDFSSALFLYQYQIFFRSGSYCPRGECLIRLTRCPGKRFLLCNRRHHRGGDCLTALNGCTQERLMLAHRLHSAHQIPSRVRFTQVKLNPRLTASLSSTTRIRSTAIAQILSHSEITGDKGRA